MKTFLRAILAGVLLVGCLAGILLSPLPAWLGGLLDAGRTPLLQSPAPARVAAFGLAALAGALSDGLVFLLVPVTSPWVRRVFHALGLAAVFCAGLLILGAVHWPAAGGAAAPLDLATGTPFILLGAFGFAGYLLVTLVVRPAPRLSRVLVSHLTGDEEVLCCIQQTRWKHPITPDSVVATNRRVIVYGPTNLGFTSTIEDYNYVDIANIKTYRGWLFSTVSLQPRFQSDSLEFHDIGKRRADAFSRVVTEQLRLDRSQVPLSAPPASRAGAGGPPQPPRSNRGG